jgi:dockerin type I repeat protein/fimbrillin-A associated anchor protein Mfa1/Mfa2
MVVVENANPCLSPLPTPLPPETITINGIPFLKQTGEDGGVGHLHQWVAYSTLRDNACVSLDFTLHSLNAGNFSTPPPVFDYAAESAVFEQIVSTFAWLAQMPTATPTASTPMETPTPIVTSTPVDSPTPTPIADGTVTGMVIASKPATVGLYDSGGSLVTSVPTNADGSFLLTAPSGTYTLIAVASGFLNAQGSVTLIGGSTITQAAVDLVSGDIDNNGVIDQFDAMTIGMSYNTSTPAAADLNNDGTINVLDLEILAKNYRKTGPVAWQ